MCNAVNTIINLSRPCIEADFLISIFGGFSKDVVSGKIPVVLFGAGSAGQELYPNMMFHGVYPVCFCDNNPLRAGTSQAGIPVISFEELKQKHKASLIVITTNTYVNEITTQLLDSGFSPEKILHIDNDRLFYYARFYNYHLPITQLQQDAQLIQEAYDLLSDHKSRDIFINRMALFASGADYPALRKFVDEFSEIFQKGPNETSNSESSLYFNNSILGIQDGEILVDAGAYTGDSVDEFVKECERLHVYYNGIYCFEPDPENYTKLLRNTSKYRNVRCFNLGLWSHRTTLRFASSAQIDSFATRVIRETGDTDIIAPRTGDVVINTTSIDEQFPDNNITFIKMDIEGAETEAINGAANTIQINKPKLAISAYHLKDDLYRLPILVHKICPEYKLYLRHFSNYYFDTVLLATM